MVTTMPLHSLFQIYLKFRKFNVDFSQREENWRTLRKTFGARTRTNNKVNSDIMPGPGMKPRPQWWKAIALTTVPPFSPT